MTQQVTSRQTNYLILAFGNVIFRAKISNSIINFEHSNKSHIVMWKIKRESTNISL